MPAAGTGSTARVLFLVGDVHHGAILQEHMWREVLADTGWRLGFAQSAAFVTAGELARTDLFVVCRYAGPDTLGFSPDELVESRTEPAPFITPELEALLETRVREGMGLIATHCSIYNPESPRFLALLGVEKPYMHGPIVPVTVHKLNPDHPITRGIQPFDTGPDEAFSAILLPKPATPLFNIKQTEPPLDALGGWVREEQKGRVVVIFPGHNSNPYMVGPYKDIMWRSAHWALGREIPDRMFADGYTCGDGPTLTTLL